MEGPTRRLDPRTHAFRRDIADVELAHLLFAPHYARAQYSTCVTDFATVHGQPSAESPATSQLTYGEDFAVIDQAGDWAWGRCAHDDYVGYVPAQSLGPMQAVTHRVVTPLALVFAQPDIKAAIVARRAIGAKVAGQEEGDFLRLSEGYIHKRHVAPLDDAASDPVTVAERMIGAPYRWGGRGADGIDCSGLVQRALELAGVKAPRDSDMQRDQIGETLAEGEPLQRGDLVFFPGHVGLMVDNERLIHANAFWMTTIVEPLVDIVARLRPTHDRPILARKRMTI